MTGLLAIERERYPDRPMRMLPGWVALAAVLGGATLAPVAAAAAPQSPREQGGQPVELLAPQAAIPLAAGSTAVLQWAPLSALTYNCGTLPSSDDELEVQKSIARSRLCPDDERMVERRSG